MLATILRNGLQQTQVLTSDTAKQWGLPQVLPCGKTSCSAFLMTFFCFHVGTSLSPVYVKVTYLFILVLQLLWVHTWDCFLSASQSLHDCIFHTGSLHVCDFITSVSELWNSLCGVRGEDGSDHLVLLSIYIPLLLCYFLLDLDLWSFLTMVVVRTFASLLSEPYV